MKTRSGRVLRYVATAASAFGAQTARRAISNLSQRLANRAVGSKNAQRDIYPGVISTQHDVSMRYRRKRMPRRKRKRWVRFTRKVQHSIMQMQPLQSYTIDYPGAFKTIAVNTQVTDGQMIGGVSATNNNELLNIFRRAYGSTLSLSGIDKYKIFLKSMCCDFQLNNSGSSSIIVDVYHLICRTNDWAGNRIDVQYTNAFAESSAGSGGTVDSTNPATTPFQNATFCSLWKVLSKKEILLGAGQISTFQVRVPYNKYFNGKMLENNFAAVPGFTRAVLFQVRGAPENNAGTPRLAAGSFTWMCQFTASYGVPPSSTTSATTSND